jgi:hypothetical protein
MIIRLRKDQNMPTQNYNVLFCAGMKLGLSHFGKNTD